MKDMQDDESNYQDVSSAGSVDVLGSAAAFGAFRWDDMLTVSSFKGRCQAQQPF